MVVVDGDVCALLSEMQGDFAAEAFAGAGDEGDFACEWKGGCR